MIIFGTRGITTTPEKGDFHCPSCNSAEKYKLKRVRRFFTLYFIPLIPLDKLGEYVECTTCNDTYKPTVLSYDPVANAQAIEAEYHAAIKKVMIHVLLADGVIDDAEVKTAMDIYYKVSGKKIFLTSFREEIKSVENSNEDLSALLENLQGCLNDGGKERVITSALYVALADGKFQQEEKDLINKIGNDLGMTPAHVQGVISSAQ